MIKHIEFWVSDMKCSTKFYKRLFHIIGWKQTERNAFINNQTKIYFIEHNVKAQKTIGPRHICFSANSRKIVDDVGKLLTKNKHDIIRGPVKSSYKNRSSYTIDFRDPDGYVLEVATKSIISR